VNAAAQLVAAGIGVGIFPKRMIEAYRPSGALAVIATRPQLTVGRVYLAHHVTADTDRIEAVMRVIENVTANLNYFDVKRERRKSHRRVR
jgi:DNA-binding transcriptional LysR family regulator